MRPTRPAAAHPPAYPRLRVAWALLAAPLGLAPATAGADTTLPPVADATTPGKTAPAPRPHPPLKGKIAYVRPVEEPPSAKPVEPPAQPRAPGPGKIGGAKPVARPTHDLVHHTLLIHPHHPGEPCRTISDDEREPA